MVETFRPLSSQEMKNSKLASSASSRMRKSSTKSQKYFAGRIDRVELAFARAKCLHQLKIEQDWTQGGIVTANELVSEPGPYGLLSGDSNLSVLK